MTGDWRSNVLLLSNDTNLTDGLTPDQHRSGLPVHPGRPGPGVLHRLRGHQHPDLGGLRQQQQLRQLHVGEVLGHPGPLDHQLLGDLAVRPRDRQVGAAEADRPLGRLVPRPRPPTRPGDQNFQQMAYVLQPESKVAPGRHPLRLRLRHPGGPRRFGLPVPGAEGAVTDLKQYEYWDGSTWVRQPGARPRPVIGDSTKSTGLFGWAHRPGQRSELPRRLAGRLHRRQDRRQRQRDERSSTTTTSASTWCSTATAPTT